MLGSDVSTYVEPFCGSLAVLLLRPDVKCKYEEIVNNSDGLLVNAWRSIQLSPEETARAASWPIIEADKDARQLACLKWREDNELEHLFGDPLFHDPVVAGWWIYGVCCQIGPFVDNGPWTLDESTGRIVKQARTRNKNMV